MVARANVIDPKKLSGDRVVFGAAVTIEDIDNGDERCYQIVGESNRRRKWSDLCCITLLAL